MTGLWCFWFVLGWWYLLDVIAFRHVRRRRAHRDGSRYEGTVLSGAVALAFPVITAILVTRQFFFDVYHIPTDSMVPNYTEGQLIVVNKFAFGLREPVTGRAVFFATAPERGDVVTFRYPREPNTVYVKRVVAIPGDEVVISEGNIELNGQAIHDPWRLIEGDQQRVVSLNLQEWLIQKAHASNDSESGREAVLDSRLVVPDGQYFVLGDNLDRSQDSRHWGFVSDKHLLGRVL